MLASKHNRFPFSSQGPRSPLCDSEQIEASKRSRARIILPYTKSARKSQLEIHEWQIGASLRELKEGTISTRISGADASIGCIKCVEHRAAIAYPVRNLRRTAVVASCPVAHLPESA